MGNKEEQERYYRSMYEWLLKEYKQQQSDREREKQVGAAESKKWNVTFEEQRVKIEELTSVCMNGDAKLKRYKEAYWKLRDKFKELREKTRSVQKELKELKENGGSRSKSSELTMAPVEHVTES